MTRLSSLFKQPKVVAYAGLLLSLVMYVLGWELLFLIVVLACLAIFLPMPRVINSWFARLVLSLIFGYSLIQIAAVLQFLIYPSGKFKLIAAFLVIETGLLIGLFGQYQSKSKLKVVIAKDICAIVGCLFFLLPFRSILIGDRSVERVTKIASTQIVDGIAHYSAVADLTGLQSLKFNYRQGNYYPLGFHISTAFMEHSLFKSIDQLSWRSHVAIYFGQYLLLGLLLCYILIYFGYAILEMAYGKPPGLIAYLALAMAIGLGVTVNDLLLYINEGFLNYYYICAAMFAGLLYLFDTDLSQGFKQLLSSQLKDKWPITAYLLITAGVALSWPLVVLPIVLRLGLWLSPAKLKDHKKIWPSLINWTNLTILLSFGLHLLAVYFQLKYTQSGQFGILAGGALHSFNLPLLLIGTIGLAGALSWSKLDQSLRRVLALAAIPTMALVAGLLLINYVLAGEARYYLIKTAEPLELFFIVMLSALLVYDLINSKLDSLSVLIGTPIVIGFIVIGSIGLLAKPLDEVRSMFRDVSGVGKPAYLDSDVRLISQLGSEGKVRNFDMTVLHYYPENGKLSSQIETALWAHNMAQSSDYGGQCFGRQFSNIAYGSLTSTEQDQLIVDVKDCAQRASRKGLTYYIVTDPGSTEKLRQLFGLNVTLVY